MSSAFDHCEDNASIDDAGPIMYRSDEYTDGPVYGNTAHFSPAVLNSPMFEGKDIAGLIGVAVMTLGPLAAYSFGFGA